MLGLVAAYLLGRSSRRSRDARPGFDPHDLPTDAEQRGWRIVLVLIAVLSVVVAVFA